MASSLKCEAVARAGLGEPAKQEGGELLWRCAHGEKHSNGDAHPSLKINPKKNVWMCGPCSVGGTAWQLAAFIAGLNAGDKKGVAAWLVSKGLLPERERKGKADGRGPAVAEFVHCDVNGNPVYKKVRHEPGENGKEKDYLQWHFVGGEWKPGDGGIIPPLYRLPQIMGEPMVFLFESHTDVDRAVELGLAATTSGGSNSWDAGYVDVLAGKDVCLVPDNDAPGARYAATVCQSLHGKVNSLRVISIAPHPDFRRWVDAQTGAEVALDRLFNLWGAALDWRPAGGAEILDSVRRFIRRFVSVTDAQAQVVALWAAHSYAIEVADFTPYLNINSAEKESGKTRLLEVIKTLVANPWGTENASPPAMVRKIHGGFEKGELVTVLFDERDSQMGADKERAEAIRGILNSGYERGGCYSRCVGEGSKMQVVDFQTFGAKALAGIGALSDTVESRSIPIRMTRAQRGTVERFRKRDLPLQREATELKSKLAAWVTADLEALKIARPDIPVALSDRQADVCEPLLAIADLAGGKWPKAAREALEELCVGARANDSSVGVNLLADIKRVFAGEEVSEVPSGKVCEALAQIETSPWGELNHGKSITPARLARLLKPFGIVPDRIGGKDSQSRGYAVRQFEDAFSRYLPASTPPETVNPSTNQQKRGSGEDFQPVNQNSVDTSRNTVSPAKNAGGGRVDTLKPGIGEEPVQGSLLTPPLGIKDGLDEEVI